MRGGRGFTLETWHSGSFALGFLLRGMESVQRMHKPLNPFHHHKKSELHLRLFFYYAGWKTLDVLTALMDYSRERDQVVLNMLQPE